MSFGITTRNGVSLGLGTTPSLVKSPPYATLRLNFLGSSAIDSILTFTRASSQTYFDSTGTLQTATTNVAAFDYDPSTLVPLGLSMWEARTNSIRNNTMVGAVAGTPGTVPTNWSVFSASGMATDVIGTGTSSGISYVDLRIHGTASATFYVFAMEAASNIAASSGQVWSESLYAAIVGGSLNNIVAVNTNVRQQGGAASTFDAAMSLTSSLIRQPTSVATLTASATYVIPAIYVQMTNGAAIDFTLRIGMPQLELGAFATPVIATTTTAATRAAPVCSTTNLGWYTQNIGTWVVAARSAIVSSGANQMMARTSDNSYNNQIAVSLSSTGFAALSTASGGVFDGLATAVAAITANTSFKAAGAFAANDLALSFNSAAVVTDSALTAPASQTVFNVGSDHAGANHFNGWIASLTYYPLRLPNATLQSLST